MYITLDPPCRQAFLASLCRLAAPAFALRLRGSVLELTDVSPSDAAWALAAGSFSVYESRLLRSLIRRRFLCFDQEEQAELLTLARALAATELSRGTVVSGPGRLRRLSELLAAELRQTGRLDFGGFCRFRLPGHRSYLGYLLDCAAAELIGRQEDGEFSRLLRELSAPRADSREWTLEFLSGGVFALTSDGQEEGGRWPGREDALLADVLFRRPRRLKLKGLAFAPLSCTACLEQALGERLDYSLNEAIDNGSGKC